MPTAPSGYSYYKAITISNTYVDADLTSFPVLVKITSDTDIGGRAASSGNNLRFALSDGTLLNYERQSFSVTGGAATGIFWVQVPTVATASSTVIYCWYDNSGASDGQNRSATWETNFKGVWHLEQDPSGSAPQMTDSTSNGANGTTNGSMTSGQLVSAKVGNGLSLDGSNDYINASLPSPAAISISMIVNATSLPISYNGVLARRSGALITLTIRSTGKLAIYLGASGTVSYDNTGSTTLSTGTNYHIAFTYDSTNGLIGYVNGVQDGTAAANGTLSSSAGTVDIGRDTGIPSNFNGIVDEVRFSQVARSAAWVKFEYRNIFEADNCETWGSEQTTGGTSSRLLRLRMALAA